MGITSDRRKELKEQFANRHPDKGIVTFRSKGRVWYMPSNDAKADYNGTSFQLRLGSWPNREMQAAYKEDPSSFEWALEIPLDYEDPSEDYTDDLDLLLMDFLEKNPDAKPMRPLKKR